MNRKSMVAALIGAGIVAVFFAAVSMAATGGKTSTGTTIHLIEHDTSFSFVSAAGPREGRTAKPGDEAVFTANLLTTSKQPAGHVNVNCVATTGGANPALQCTGTFSLAGGTIVGSALIHANGRTPSKIAILGGTGAYEGASGTILSVPSKTNQNVSYDTVHLLP
jgi:hypothetical protein